MNVLVSKTSATIVMFTDANVLIDRSAVAVLRRYFADPAIGCVCSDLHYLSAGASATADVGAAYWRFNEWTKGLETATGSVMGADGSLFAIRRRLHRPVPDGLFDDLYVSSERAPRRLSGGAGTGAEGVRAAHHGLRRRVPAQDPHRLRVHARALRALARDPAPFGPGTATST